MEPMPSGRRLHRRPVVRHTVSKPQVRADNDTNLRHENQGVDAKDQGRLSGDGKQSG